MDWSDNVEVRIRRVFELDALEIYIFEKRGQDTALAHWRSVGEDGRCELIFEPFDHVSAVRVEPTVLLPRPLGNIFLQAVSEFAMDEGIKPARHEKLEGVLEAQGRHLLDVRRLLGSVMKVELEKEKTQ